MHNKYYHSRYNQNQKWRKKLLSLYVETEELPAKETLLDIAAEAADTTEAAPDAIEELLDTAGEPPDATEEPPDATEELRDTAEEPLLEVAERLEPTEEPPDDPEEPPDKTDFCLKKNTRKY